jgi:hypothetical protein
VLPQLFDVSTVSENFNRKKYLLQKYLKDNKRASNISVISFVAELGLDTRHANVIIKEMRRNNNIKIEYIHKDKQKGFYVSDNRWKDHLADIIYIGSLIENHNS